MTSDAGSTGVAAPAWLAHRIALDGPMTVAEFMTACLHDPRSGYYAVQPRLGAQGDFVTAPLISQMFGELVGAWIGQVWRQLGSPSPWRLVELGPGDGTLMSDVLRVLRLAPEALAAMELWLVEPSRPLRAAQSLRLEDVAYCHVDALTDVRPGAPLILLANEMLDCLAARQFVATTAGWTERHVGLDETGALAFGLAPAPEGVVADLPPGAPPGSVMERSPAQTALAAEIGARVVQDGGAALLIDYGRDTAGFGDTLQAVACHARVDVLTTAGQADLTMHVDFPAIVAVVEAQGGATSPIVTQRAFLQALGIGPRSAALVRSRPDLADTLARQVHRLISPDQMGDLFKVLSIHTPGLDPPGFAGQEPRP